MAIKMINGQIFSKQILKIIIIFSTMMQISANFG
jgi:hypothetical protein